MLPASDSLQCIKENRWHRSGTCESYAIFPLFSTMILKLGDANRFYSGKLVRESNLLLQHRKCESWILRRRSQANLSSSRLIFSRFAPSRVGEVVLVAVLAMLVVGVDHCLWPTLCPGHIRKLVEYLGLILLGFFCFTKSPQEWHGPNHRPWEQNWRT